MALDSPAYAKLTVALRELALGMPWSGEGLFPAEGELAEQYGVSRGTLRRATQELVREGLLSAEPGRGTYVRRTAQLRMRMRETLRAIAIPDSRWDLDVLSFVPDFDGSSECTDRLASTPMWAEADFLLVAPDNSLRGVIVRALEHGKRVLVPTYGLRRGFVLLDPDVVPAVHRGFAATLDGLEQFGTALDLDALSEVPHIDMVVTGAIALTTGGAHIGSGRAYLDLEWGILARLGRVDDSTRVVGVVHDDQYVDVPIAPGRFDVLIDLVVTPSAEHAIDHGRSRPAGLQWSALRDEQIESIAYLADLRAADHPRERVQ